MSAVSRETNERLQHYARLLIKWNPTINLVGKSTLHDINRRHLDDCMQLAALAGGSSGKWADLGSGGGLPGIVLAIALADQDIAFHLLESDQRKGIFLKAVVRELALTNVEIIPFRIEATSPIQADNVSARALASLETLLGMADRHLRQDGTAWFMKGRAWRQEVDEAQKRWSFDVQPFTSSTDPEAAILRITGVSHA